jgi:cytochrome P450
MEEKRKIPKVPLFQFLKHSANILKNPLPFHHKNFEAQGDIFTLRIGFKSRIYFSRDAAFAQYVLQKNQKNYVKSKIQTKDLVKYVGRGLLTSEGELWKKQRKLIQPAFHKKQLENLLSSMREAILLEYKRITPNKTINIFPILNDLAFQTVVKSLFSSVATSKEISRLQEITESSQRMLVKELRQPYLGWWFQSSGLLKRHLQESQEAKDILKNIANTRKTSGVRQNDLLDMLLDARYEDGSEMEEGQLVDEILILFTAGHETTSNALTFIFQLLAKHPEWQDKIHNEITANSNLDLMQQVSTFKITQQVIEESMRLYPPVYFLDRVNKTPDTFNGMEFPAGCNLLFSVFEMHRHKDLWDNPEEFIPERFADGGRKFSAFYFPFGAGPRKCIGNNFAMFEMIIAVAELVRKYKFTAEFDDIEITPLITLKPKNAFLKFEER